VSFTTPRSVERSGTSLTPQTKVRLASGQSRRAFGSIPFSVSCVPMTASWNGEGSAGKGARSLALAEGAGKVAA